MMTQPLPCCQYLPDESNRKLTRFGGLPLFIDMAIKSGLTGKIAKTLNTKSQGWNDLQIILSLMLLNIAGGDCVDDIERLEQDAGFATVIQSLATHGMTRKERRAFEKRWRKGKERALPSPSVLRRYLEQFHNAEEEEKRIIGKAFIPADNIELASLKELNTVLIHFLQNQLFSEVATIDQDATLSATNKKSALFCYKNFKSYQPLNTYWSEHGVLLRSEFRDGTEQEWAEINFVTNWSSYKKSNPNYRYLAVREKMVDQQELDLGDSQPEQKELPFQTIDVTGGKYKLHGIVTNRKISGNDLINWHRERCGASEKVHSVIKSELAGGQFPSKYFGANAAWWQIMLIAFNLNILMKKLVLPEALQKKALKGLRFHLINLPGLVIYHARKLFIKLGGGIEVFDFVSSISKKIMVLGYGPPRPLRT